MATLSYTPGNCFFNAYLNKTRAYKHMNLRLCFGSVAFNGFFEYGGRNWTLTDFKARHTPGTYVFDAHAWLEDDDGNIYDKVFGHYNYCAMVQTGNRMKIDDDTLWEAVSPQHAKEMGVEYVKADKETQTYILLELLPFFKGLTTPSPTP